LTLTDQECTHDVKLLNPFSPLLLAALDEAGQLVDLALLPFPSLLRHGLHHAEVCAAAYTMSVPEGVSEYAWTCLLNHVDDRLPRVRQLELNIAEAFGTEQLCRPAMLSWLADVWGVSVVDSEHAAPPETQASDRGLKLKIQGNGVPTLRALTGLSEVPAEELACPAPFLLVDPYDFKPQFLCSMGREPRAGAQAAELAAPHVTAQADIVVWLGSAAPFRTIDPIAVHLAVEVVDQRYPLMFPTDLKGRQAQCESGAPRCFEAVLHGSGDADDLAYSLWSLANQVGTRVSRVLIGISTAAEHNAAQRTIAEVAHRFPEGALQLHQHEPTLSVMLAQASGLDGLLVMKKGLCLHQEDTLALLADLLAPEDVVSAGCMLVQEVQYGKGRRVTCQSCGLYPDSLLLSRVGELKLVQTEVLGSLGLRDFSVLSNVPDLVLLKSGAGALPAAAGPSSAGTLVQSLLDASVDAVLQGALHRVSTRTSASYRSAPVPGRGFRLSPRVQSRVLAGLPHLLAASTLLRSLES
jgi:hypothetical protein